MDPHLTEGGIVPRDLTPYWKDVNDRYRSLTESEPAYRCVRWLLEHIIDTGYSKNLFPGTSMYSLLVSLPVDGKVNYTRTLRVAYDEQAQVVSLQLKIWPDPQRSPHDIEKGIKWSVNCQPSEVIETFEHFLNEHSDWSRTARQS